LHASGVKFITKCAKVAKHPTWQTANICDIALRIEFGSVCIQ